MHLKQMLWAATNIKAYAESLPESASQNNKHASAFVEDPSEKSFLKAMTSLLKENFAGDDKANDDFGAMMRKRKGAAASDDSGDEDTQDKKKKTKKKRKKKNPSSSSDSSNAKAKK